MTGWVLIAAVVIGGALIAAQGPIYARMSLELDGALRTGAIGFSIGAVALIIAVTFAGGGFPSLSQIRAVPLWAWFGGLIGVYVVLVSVLAVPRMGVASYSACVIAGQLTASAAYDRAGVFGTLARDFSAANLIGLIMVGTGAVLVLWR